MRNLPRFALVPLAVLITALPLVSFPAPAGADTAADCQTAFTTAQASGLTYTTEPAIRLAWTGQTVRMAATWDPSAWDALTSAAACVRLDDDVFDETLGTAAATPENNGVFDHSFVIPDVHEGARLCTRIRVSGDPAGEATDAVWVTRMHCFEVDHDVEEQTPPDDTTPTTQSPGTTTSTMPAAAPASSGGTSSADTPAEGAPPASAEGGDSAVGTPFDDAEATSGSPTAPVPGAATTPEMLPLLPATGYSSLRLVHAGEASVLIGLGLLVLGGLLRRRHRTA